MSERCLRVAFIGAGRVNFGNSEGPWDHASRLEQIPNVEIVAIVDPLTEVAHTALTRRRAGVHARIYEGCQVYSSTKDLLQHSRPDVVIIGTPPFVRGSLEDGKDLELQYVRKGVHVFVEKPLSLAKGDNFKAYVEAMMSAQAEAGVIVSVGYMFRYHAAVRKMKELIDQHGGHVMALTARYTLAYEHADNPHWWDSRCSGGPIVEQATHLCDVARYLAGDIVNNSVQTVCVRDEGAGSAGSLAKVPAGCDVGLPDSARAPRVTVSQWRFTSGGVGCLLRIVALHGKKYDVQVEVIMDGMRLVLDDPYTSACTVRVRRSGSEEEEVLTFPDDDPYMTEMEHFLQAVRTGDGSGIASSYVDASKTYFMTWAIRNAEK